MKIHKGPPASDAARGAATGGKRAKKGEVVAAPSSPPNEKPAPSITDEIERALLEEVSGTHASAQKLRTIVERVLGGGEDSDVRALVQRLAKAARSQTGGPH